LDDLIVALADAQTGTEVAPIDVIARHAIQFRDKPESWAYVAAKEMESRGWGSSYVTWGEHFFKINGAGLARAQQVREERRKKSFAERMRQIPRSDWIAIFSALVSLGALSVSIVALWRP